jgi:hypothetical protein
MGGADRLPESIGKPVAGIVRQPVARITGPQLERLVPSIQLVAHRIGQILRRHALPLRAADDLQPLPAVTGDVEHVVVFDILQVVDADDLLVFITPDIRLAPHEHLGRLQQAVIIVPG